MTGKICSQGGNLRRSRGETGAAAAFRKKIACRLQRARSAHNAFAAAAFAARSTRKSSEEGLEQEFNFLDAQREACEACGRSQKHEGWRSLRQLYDDPGFSGGNMERPALKRLLADLVARKVDVVVVYKVDRLTRSLADFAKIFDANSVSFVSITQGPEVSPQVLSARN